MFYSPYKCFPVNNIAKTFILFVHFISVVNSGSVFIKYTVMTTIKVALQGRFFLLFTNESANQSIKSQTSHNAKENAGNRVSEGARRERVIDNNFSLCNSNGNSLTYLRTYALFLKSNTFISNARLKSTKKLSKSYATPWGWTFAIWKLFALLIHVIIQKY